MMRSGLSPRPLPHARLGIEATGTIDALGPGVHGWVTGDAVIVTAVPKMDLHGSTYADHIVAPADRAAVSGQLGCVADHADAREIGCAQLPLVVGCGWMCGSRRRRVRSPRSGGNGFEGMPECPLTLPEMRAPAPISPTETAAYQPISTFAEWCGNLFEHPATGARTGCGAAW